MSKYANIGLTKFTKITVTYVNNGEEALEVFVFPNFSGDLSLVEGALQASLYEKPGNSPALSLLSDTGTLRIGVVIHFEDFLKVVERKEEVADGVS